MRFDILVEKECQNAFCFFLKIGRKSRILIFLTNSNNSTLQNLVHRRGASAGVCDLMPVLEIVVFVVSNHSSDGSVL